MAKFTYKKLSQMELDPIKGTAGFDLDALIAKQIDGETAKLFVTDSNGKILEVVPNKNILSLVENGSAPVPLSENVLSKKKYDANFSDGTNVPSFLEVTEVDFNSLSQLIQTKITEATNPILTTLQSDDLDLDTVQEIVNYIKKNRADLSGLSDTKPVSLEFNNLSKELKVNLSDGTNVATVINLDIPDTNNIAKSLEIEREDTPTEYVAKIKLLNSLGAVLSEPVLRIEKEVNIVGNFI